MWRYMIKWIDLENEIPIGLINADPNGLIGNYGLTKNELYKNACFYGVGMF